MEIYFVKRGGVKMLLRAGDEPLETDDLLQVYEISDEAEIEEIERTLFPNSIEEVEGYDKTKKQKLVQENGILRFEED